jgi:hypothetical protein
MKCKRLLIILITLFLPIFSGCADYNKMASAEILINSPDNKIPFFPVDILEKENNIYVLDNGGDPCASPIIQRPVVKVYSSNYKHYISIPLRTLGETSFYADPIKLEVSEGKVIILTNVATHIKDISNKFDTVYIYTKEGKYVSEIEARDKYIKFRDIEIIEGNIWVLSSSFIEGKAPSIISIYTNGGKFIRDIEINMFISSFLKISNDKLLLLSRINNSKNEIFTFDIKTENISKLKSIDLFITDICKLDDSYFISYLAPNKKSILAITDLNFEKTTNLTNLNYPLARLRIVNNELWILQIKETCNNNLLSYFKSEQNVFYLSADINSVMRKYDFNTKTLVPVLSLFNGNSLQYVYFPLSISEVNSTIAILDSDYKITYFDNEKTIKDMKYIENLELSSNKAFEIGENGIIYVGTSDGYIKIIGDKEYKNILVPDGICEIHSNADGRLFILSYDNILFELINNDYLEKIYSSKSIKTFCAINNNLLIVEPTYILLFDVNNKITINKTNISFDFTNCWSATVINQKILCALTCDKDCVSQLVLLELETGNVLKTISGVKESILNTDENNINPKKVTFFRPTEIDCINNSIFISDFGNSRVLKCKIVNK